MSEIFRMQNIEYEINRKRILSIPEFQLLEGMTCGIMGPNGAGKSTLLKLISLLDPPSKGDLFFMVRRFPRKRSPWSKEEKSPLPCSNRCS